jgi:hypothetical protein
MIVDLQVLTAASMMFRADPEDSSEHHTRRRENLKSHIEMLFTIVNIL